MKYLSLFIFACAFAFQTSAQDAGQASKPQIFTFVQQMPAFPGGDAAMTAFLSQNIKYPIAARDSAIQGTVLLQFVVNEDGSISDVKALRTVAGGCTEEAIRVIKAMPKWKPAIQNNTPVKVYFHLPVIFKLDGVDKKKK